MKKRFIVLIDFSAESANLLSYAYDWSKQIHADIVLVYQKTVMAPSLVDTKTREGLAEFAREEAIEKLRNMAEENVSNTERISYFVSEDHLQNMLEKLLDQDYEDLVFVSSKEVGGLRKLFVESTAIQVIDNSKNIVVAMPKDMVRFSHEKIFVAVTDKFPLNVVELNNFLRFIDKTKTSIIFFYLGKPNEETLEMEKQLKDLVKLFSERYHTGYAIYEGRDALTDIKKVINNKIDELLVVQKGSRLLTDQLFRKFLINELVNEGQTPLIVLPN